jgi:hypothetical protein
MTDGANSQDAKEQQVARDLAALSAVLQPRIEQARRGELSTKTFEEIRKEAHRRARLQERL